MLGWSLIFSICGLSAGSKQGPRGPICLLVPERRDFSESRTGHGPAPLNMKLSKTYEVVTCSFGAGASPLRVALRTGVWLWNWCVGLNGGELHCR